MKLGTLFILETINSKRFGDNFILANFDAIVILLIYCQFGARGKPEFGCSSYFFINDDFSSCKSGKQK